MGLADEVRRIGRRNFLKAVGGVSALAAMATTAVVRGPRRGGPVRAALIGYGKQGRLLRSCMDPEVINLVAVCDIQPPAKPDIAQNVGVRWYQDWQHLLQEESFEAVLIATPLFTHAEIASRSLEAGRHVFCETAMAKDDAGCRQMIQTAQRNRRILAVGYQNFYEPLYWSAYHNILKQGILGDIYTVEAVWHSDSSGRVESKTDAANFDPRPWGYTSREELSNWRLYRRYSNGLMDEWGGSLISLTNWFLQSVPTAIQSSGGIYSYRDGRDVADHVYATIEYPRGRTATLSLIQSNGFEGSYLQLMGTKGTLLLGKDEALLFAEESSKRTSIEVAKLGSSQPVMDTSASRKEEASSHAVLAGNTGGRRGGSSEALQQELAAFCGAIRTGAPFRCNLDHAYQVASTCFAVDSSMEQNKRLASQGSFCPGKESLQYV